MRIIRAGYQLINDKEFDSPLQKVERIARICYKSEDKITGDSYKRMAEMLMKKQHLAMFEHANLVFEVNDTLYTALAAVIAETNLCRIRTTSTYLSGCVGGGKRRNIVSGNIRAWCEFFRDNRRSLGLTALYEAVHTCVDNLFEIDEFEKHVPCGYSDVKQITDFSIFTDAERLVHETFTVVFTCDRGVTHELVRMRDASFAQESTRYCNYQLGKFGKEITVIKPCFFADENSVGYLKWKDACEYAEKMYFMLLDGGATPQEARSVLPTSVKADIAVTANLYEWRHIFNLRACDATGPAHPQMKEIMVPLFEEMCEVYPSIIGILKK